MQNDINKKRILFVYDKMVIGGSTTSLLSLLEMLDTDKYEIDLLLYSKNGPLQNLIPPNVKILCVSKFDLSRFYLLRLLYFIFSRYFLLFIKCLIKKVSKKEHINFLRLVWQFSNPIKAQMTKKIKNIYDCAIGYIEGWPNSYVSFKTKAHLKNAWVHLDYKDSYLEKESYEDTYNNINNIVLVSSKCKNSFDSTYAKFSCKSIHIDNIMSQKVIIKRSNEHFLFDQYPKISHDHYNLISICRVDFAHKGLDRVFEAFLKLQEGRDNPFEWYIIGEGPDSLNLKSMIDKAQMNNRIHLLGAIKNPLPFLKQMDCFILTSRYEGKPIAVTEALMLGKPCIVSNYSSASEQIVDGFNGAILENNDKGVIEGLLFLAKNIDLLKSYSENLHGIDYSNLGEVQKVENIINE